MQQDLISIGMPVFNDCRFIHKAIGSILKQSYTYFELVLSDDCSSDGSAEICKQYEAQDSRIKYIRQEKNIGISRNMEFLLRQAQGTYFMWAANDDMWSGDFLRLLKANFDKNPNAVSSFCAYAQVDEEDRFIENRRCIVEAYDLPAKHQRVLKLVREFNDGFGYALFRREAITGVRFPVWWWINRRCAYDNIFPTLCYYLTKGDYIILSDQVLWFNRVKNEEHVSHKIPYSHRFIPGYLAFALRKLNLVYASMESVVRAENGLSTAVQVFPRMLFSWFIVPVFLRPVTKYRAWKKGENVFL